MKSGTIATFSFREYRVHQHSFLTEPRTSQSIVVSTLDCSRVVDNPRSECDKYKQGNEREEYMQVEGKRSPVLSGELIHVPREKQMVLVRMSRVT